MSWVSHRSRSERTTLHAARSASGTNRKAPMTEPTRRRVLQAGAGLAATGAIASNGAADVPARPNFYEALGVKPVINAVGTVTVLGGSVMPPEVVAAWAEAARHFVDLVLLQDRVGERIAKAI